MQTFLATLFNPIFIGYITVDSLASFLEDFIGKLAKMHHVPVKTAATGKPGAKSKKQKEEELSRRKHDDPRCYIFWRRSVLLSLMFYSDGTGLGYHHMCDILPECIVGQSRPLTVPAPPATSFTLSAAFIEAGQASANLDDIAKIVQSLGINAAAAPRAFARMRR